MKRRILGLTCAIILNASPLAADDFRTEISRQLRAQGYQSIEVTKTWLGRLRFQAERNGTIREIILNPRSGEILRDFQAAVESGLAAVPRILDRSIEPLVEQAGDPNAGGPGRPGPGPAGAGGPEAGGPSQ